MSSETTQTRKKTTTAWVVALTAIGSLMAALDTLVVSTSLNAIRLDLGASVEQLEWTLNAYNLSFAVLLITAAALGDRYGRRAFYAIGLGLFAAASAAAALAPSVGFLVAARAAQGAGAALVLTLGLTLLTAAFPPEKRGAAIGLFSAVTGLAAGAVLVAAFIGWELRAAEPMVPMRFFRSRAFSAGNAAIFFTLASLFGAVFFFAQMLQTALGYGPLDAGLRLMPWTVTFITVAPVVGRLVDRFGERPFMVGGLTLQAIGMGWIALIADHGLTYSEFLIPSILAGVGVSMAIPAAQNSVVGSFSIEDIGKAAGANSTMRELGGVFGVAVAAAVFAGAGSYASPDAFLDGFAPAVAVLAAFSALGAIVALALPGRRPTTAQSLPVGPVPAFENAGGS